MTVRIVSSMKAPWFRDGVTTETSGRRGSASMRHHCSAGPAQLPEERHLRPGRVGRPQEAQSEPHEAVPISAAPHEALVERRERRAENVPRTGHEALLQTVAPLEPEIAPVLLDQCPPPGRPVMRDRVVARVVDDLDRVARKRLRPGVDGGPQLCAAAPCERSLPAYPAPHCPAQRP